MEHRELPPHLQKLFRVGKQPNQFSLHTKKGFLTKFFGVVILFLACQSLFLAFVLDGRDKVFYTALLFVTLPVGIYLFSKSQRLVLDIEQGDVFFQRSTLWRSPVSFDSQPASHLEVLLKRGNEPSKRIVTLCEQTYEFSNTNDAHAVMDFLMANTEAKVLEQVSDWPNKKPWREDRKIFGARNTVVDSPSNQKSTELPSGGLSSENTAPRDSTLDEEKLNQTTENDGLPELIQGRLTPIWTKAALWRLAIPIPIFIGLAALFKYGVLS